MLNILGSVESISTLIKQNTLIMKYISIIEMLNDKKNEQK